MANSWPPNTATVLRVLRESLVTDAPIVQQHRLSGRELLVFCSRVKDVCDEVIGFSVVAIDITERDAAARQLELSEEHMRRATELHLDIVWAAEPDGTLSYIGPTIADVAGESMQQRIERWVARMHPGDYAQTHERWLQWVPMIITDIHDLWMLQEQLSGEGVGVVSRPLG